MQRLGNSDDGFIMLATFEGTTIATEGDNYNERILVTFEEIDGDREKFIENVKAIAKVWYKLVKIEYLDLDILEICKKYGLRSVVWEE